MEDESPNKHVKEVEGLEKILDDYEKSIQLPQVKLDNKIEEYLNYTIEDINDMPIEHVAAVAYRIAGYSFRIQREINRHHAKANWACANIDTVAIKAIDDYVHMPSAVERRQAVIAYNSLANRLEKVRVYAQARVDSLNQLTQRLEFIAKMLSDVKYLKRRPQNG